jgi:hypothetical protein
VDDFRGDDDFLLLRVAMRGLREDDPEEGAAIERVAQRVADRYGIDVDEVFAALNEGTKGD